MSGGSYNYIYSELFRECEGRMHDAEMEDLVSDLCKVLHDLEWWQSCDSSEKKYRAAVEKFKSKWLKEDRIKLKGYIDETIEMLIPVSVLCRIMEEIDDEAEYAYADFDEYKCDVLHAEPDELPDDDFRYGLRRAIEIINKYRAESEDKE